MAGNIFASMPHWAWNSGQNLSQRLALVVLEEHIFPIKNVHYKLSHVDNSWTKKLTTQHRRSAIITCAVRTGALDIGPIEVTAGKFFDDGTRGRSATHSLTFEVTLFGLVRLECHARWPGRSTRTIFILIAAWRRIWITQSSWRNSWKDQLYPLTLYSNQGSTVTTLRFGPA